MIAKDLLTIDKNQLSAKTGISLERIKKIQEITFQIVNRFKSDYT
jgi:hypothetical protein